MNCKLKLILLLLALMCISGCKVAQKKQVIDYMNPKQNITYDKTEVPLMGVDLNKPTMIDSDEKNLYICDSGNDRIVVWSFENKLVRTIGMLGSGQAEFISPNCIAVNDDCVCVYDSGNYRIQVLTKEGLFVSEISLSESIPRNSKVTDIEIDTSGTIYLSVMLWGDDLKKSGLYRYAAGNFELIEPITVTKICDCAEENAICCVSQYELENKNAWTTGYAEISTYKDGNCINKNAFSSLFSAVDIVEIDGAYYVFDDCSRKLYIFNKNGICEECVFEDEVPSKLIYSGFAGTNKNTLYLTEITEGKVYMLCPVKEKGE